MSITVALLLQDLSSFPLHVSLGTEVDVECPLILTAHELRHCFDVSFFVCSARFLRIRSILDSMVCPLHDSTHLLCLALLAFNCWSPLDSAFHRLHVQHCGQSIVPLRHLGWSSSVIKAGVATYFTFPLASKLHVFLSATKLVIEGQASVIIQQERRVIWSGEWCGHQRQRVILFKRGAGCIE